MSMIPHRYAPSAAAAEALKSGTVGARQRGGVWGGSLLAPQFWGPGVTTGNFFENIRTNLRNLHGAF